MRIRVCRSKNAGVAGYAEAFRPVHSDLQTSEWYSYFENDVLDFVSLHCNARNYIRSTTQDSAILTYFIMNTVHKDKRINRVQRTGLPFLNQIGRAHV